ncbi:MAG: hypothetical protein ACJ8OJ_02630 [Povalibacter sp.]
MNTVANLSHSSQRAVCLFFAALIVTCSLTIGAVGTEVAFDNAVALSAR